MKILTRYVLREFLAPFALSLFAFAVIILIIRVFDEIRFLMDHRPDFPLALRYFLHQLPFLVLQATPVAVLMAVLFSLGRLARSGELVALRAGGVSLTRVARPLVAAGLAVFAACVAFNETVVPGSNAKAKRIRWEQIEGKEAPRRTHRRNVALRGDANRMYHIGEVWGDRDAVRDVLILEFSDGIQLKSRLDAAAGEWKDGMWTFRDGVLRVFDETGRVTGAERFTELQLALPEKPADFLQEQREPREMTFAQLLAHVQQLRRSGSDHRKELVELHLKMAFPFSCVVLAVLGIPWGWSMGRYSGVAASFGVCLLVAFGYVGLLEVGHALGASGVLPPFWSVWLPNFLFGGFGLWLLMKKNR